MPTHSMPGSPKSDNQRNQIIDHNGVRAPAPSYIEQLLPNDRGTAASVYPGHNGELMRDYTFDEFFPLPSSLKNPHSLRKALKNAWEQGKQWLLINIQEKNSFYSHQLSRDIWRSESVLAVIEAHFCFWQRDCSEPEGSEFCDLYQIKTFPHICALHSQTGMYHQQWKIVKFSDEFAAASELLDFIESHGISGPTYSSAEGTTVPIYNDSADEKKLRSNIVSSSDCRSQDNDTANQYEPGKKSNESLLLASLSMSENSTIKNTYSESNAILKALHQERSKRQL